MIANLRSFLFENKSVRQTIAKNTFWLSSGEILGRIFRTAIVIYAARVLGPTEWGVFSYALSLTALLTAFSDIGLGAVLIREGAKDIENRYRYFSTAFFIKAVLIIGTFLALVFLLPQLSKIPLSQYLILFIALLFVFDALRGFGTALFRAAEKMEREAIVNILTQVVILISGLIVINNFVSAEALAAAYALGAGVGLILTIYLTRHYIKEIFSRFDRKLVRPIFDAAWPFSFLGIYGAIMINTDIIMIGTMLGATQVGFYSAAQKPILLLYILPSLIAGGFFPVLAKLAETDKERFRSIFEKGLKVVFFAAIPAALAFFLMAQDIIPLLYGSEYLPGVAPLKILSLTLLTTFPMSLIINAVFAHNRQKELIGVGLIGVIANVVFNFVLIPVWGISGAALSTILAQLLNNGLVWIKMKNVSDFSVFHELKKIIIASCTSGLSIIFLQYLGVSFFIIAVAAVLVYLLTLIALKEELLHQLKAMLEG